MCVFYQMQVTSQLKETQEEFIHTPCIILYIDLLIKVMMFIVLVKL